MEVFVVTRNCNMGKPKLPWKEHWRRKSTLQEYHGNKLALYHRTEFDGDSL